MKKPNKPSWILSVGSLYCEIRMDLFPQLCRRVSILTKTNQQWNSQTFAWQEEVELLQRVGKLLIQSVPDAQSWLIFLEYESLVAAEESMRSC